MKIGIFSDTHYGARSDNSSLYDYFQRSNDYFFSILEQENINTVIHLGDLFDRRKYVNFVTAKRCRQDFLEKLEERKITTHILCGNHDHTYKNTSKINSLDEMIGTRYSYITTYSEPTELIFDGKPILLLPWITESNKSRSKDLLNNSRAPYCFGHLEINGFEVQRGISMEHGMPREELDKFSMVLSGHFHHRSRIGNIQYVGAAYEMTWSDYNDPKGIGIFDTDTGSIKFYNNPYSIFKMVKYDDSMDIVAPGDCKNCYVKVVTVNRNNPYVFEKFLDEIYSQEPLDITIIEESTITEEGTELEVSNVEDTVTILNKYIDTIKVNLDLSKVKKMMTSIYNEALTLGD